MFSKAESVHATDRDPVPQLSNEGRDRLLQVEVPRIEAGNVVMASNGDDPWKRHEERQRRKRDQDNFNAEHGSSWHLWNVVEGLVMYLYAMVVFNHYLKDGAVVGAGVAALFMSSIAPFVFPFLVGYCASRYLSAIYLKSHTLYMLAHLFLGLSALAVMLSPIGIVAGLATGTVSSVVTGCCMIAGAVVGYITRHTKDQ